MRLLFVHHVVPDRGSAQDMHHYVRAARKLGHEVALYGRPTAASPFRYSVNIDAADAVIFIFEWTTLLQYGDVLDLVRLAGKVPRGRRVVIDCDGGYNDAISVEGDVNHPDDAASRRWVEVCDSLADKVFQPTYHPLRPNVRPFFFHAYDPGWERPLDPRGKEYGMFYVGNNWFRWRGVQCGLRAVQPVRDRVGRGGLVGARWGGPAALGEPRAVRGRGRPAPAATRGVGGGGVSPPVRFDAVIGQMGRGVFTPVVYRPLFDHLRLITCRTFETPAANTIPLFAQDPAFVAEVYGDEAAELALPAGRPEEKILDLLRRPEHYVEVVRGIRRHCAAKYAYEAQLPALVEIGES